MKKSIWVMKKSILCILGSLCCFIVTIYAYKQNISKLVTGAGCMCCWLLGMGIGRFFIDKEKVLNSKMKWKWLLLVTSLAFFSLFIVYVLYKW